MHRVFENLLKLRPRLSIEMPRRMAWSTYVKAVGVVLEDGCVDVFHDSRKLHSRIIEKQK